MERFWYFGFVILQLPIAQKIWVWTSQTKVNVIWKLLIQMRSEKALSLIKVGSSHLTMIDTPTLYWWTLLKLDYPFLLISSSRTWIFPVMNSYFLPSVWSLQPLANFFKTFHLFLIFRMSCYLSILSTFFQFEFC